MKTLWRITRKIGRISAITALSVLAVAMVAIIAALLWARSPSGQRKLLAIALPRIQEQLNGKLTIGRLQGDLTRGLILGDVTLRDPEGEIAVHVDRLTLRYQLLQLVNHAVLVDDLQAEGAFVHARYLADGRLNLTALVKESKETPSGKPLDLLLRRARAEVEIEFEPKPGDPPGPVHARVTLDASAEKRGDDADVKIAGLEVIADRPLRAEVKLHGGVHDAPGVISLKDLYLTAHTDGRGIDKLDPAIKLRGAWALALHADGRLGGLTVNLKVQPPKGSLAVDAKVALRTSGGVDWDGTVQASGIDPGAAWAGAPHGEVELRASGKGENSKGTIELQALTAILAGTRAHAHGRVELGPTLEADVQLDVHSPDLSRLASLGARGLSGAIDAQAHVIKGPVHLDINADVSGRDLGAAGAKIKRLSARVHAIDLQGLAMVDAHGINVRDELSLDTLQLAASGDSRALAFTLEGRGRHGASIELRAHGVPLRGEGQVSADVAIDQAAFAFRGQKWEAPAPGHLRIDRREVQYRLALASVGSKQTPAQRVDTELRYGRLDQRVRAQVAAVSGGQKLHAELNVPLAGDGAQPIEAELALEKIDLEKWKGFLPPNLRALKGKADLNARVRGTLRKPQLEAELTLPAWQYDGLDKNDAKVNLSYLGNQLVAKVAANLGSTRKRAGGLTLELSAPIDLQRGGTRKLLERLEHDTPLTLTATLTKLDLAALPFAKLGIEAPVDAGIVDAQLSLHGTVHEPVLAMKGEVHELAAGSVDQLALTLEAGYQKKRALAQLTVRLRGAPILTARAESNLDVQRVIDGQPWKDAPLRVDAAIPSYDLSHVKNLGGVLAGHIEVRGTLSHPIGKASLQAEKLALGGLHFGRFALDGAFDGKVATARLDADEERGGQVHLEANVPIDANLPIKATLIAHKLDLQLERVGALRELRGTVEAQLAISGTRKKPQLDGFLKIDQGAIAVSSDPRIYKDLVVDVRAEKGNVRLARLAVKVGVGALRASGNVQLDGLQPTKVDLHAEADRFPFQSGNVGAWVDAHVDVHGERQGGALIGKITVTKGTAHLPKLAGGRKLQSTGALVDVSYTDGKARKQRLAEAHAKQEGETVAADIAAHIPGPFKVRSAELMTDLQGDLDIKLVDGVPKIYGSVETTWGHLELLGRRYEIERVRASFGGQVDPDPALDVRVTRQITGTQIVIEVHGTAKKPHLVLSSEPPLYDQSQIIGIIISGDPGTQQISDRSTDQKVVGAISGLLVSKIKDSIAPGLPIDVIKVDTGDDGYTGLGSTRLEVGKYLTEKIYVSYVHQFGGNLNALRKANSNEADLEYRFKRHYEVATRFGDAGVGAVDFYWTYRF